YAWSPRRPPLERNGRRVSNNEPKRKGFFGRMFGSGDTPADEPVDTHNENATQAPPAAPDSAAPKEQAAEPLRKSWFDRLRSGLAKTSSRLTEGITGLVTKRKLDQDTLDELEEVLLAADLGIETSARITKALAKGRFEKTISENEIRETL